MRVSCWVTSYLRKGSRLIHLELKPSRRFHCLKPRRLFNLSLVRLILFEGLSLTLLKITKPISNLLKKYQEFKWDDCNRVAFRKIKNAISMAPVLVSPDYSRDFLVFSFASKKQLLVSSYRRMKTIKNNL
jgi:hypothetical protein